MGEAILTAKLLNVMLGDISTKTSLINTNQMTNDALTSENYLSLSLVTLLIPRGGLFSALRMVSRPVRYPCSICQQV